MAAGGTDPEVSGGSDPAGKGKKEQEMRAFRWAGTPAFSYGDWLLVVAATLEARVATGGAASRMSEN
jgi:hypothetical protein